jgi:polyisoprenyl-phosphate glycosyltransferase
MISVVIPVYNEEALIRRTYNRIRDVMVSQNGPYELIFVDDGSSDQTKSLLEECAATDPTVKVISFSRNFSHQIAITAGMEHASGDAVAIIDSDLQDPPEVIKEFIKKWREGYDVVYGVRRRRKGESIFKLFTASLFYRVIRKMTSTPIYLDAGDFRLLSRRVVEILKQMPEKHRFVRGMVSWAGFKQVGVEYDRDERLEGESKYSLSRMMGLALDGITSFSRVPLQFLSFLAILFLVISLVAVVIAWMQHDPSNTVHFLLFVIVAATSFLASVMCFGLSTIGIYIGRAADEVKSRPLYVIEEKIGF